MIKRIIEGACIALIVTGIGWLWSIQSQLNEVRRQKATNKMFWALHVRMFNHVNDMCDDMDRKRVDWPMFKGDDD